MDKFVEEKISPNFDHAKLSTPSTKDLIDVFEDLWKGCVFEPVQLLINQRNGSMAGMSVLCSYYEAIECLHTGKSSRNRSREFFIKGFAKVFSSSNSIEIVAKEVYTNVRCGLAHEGMLRAKVNYSNMGKKAFFLTYPKKQDGTLDLNGPCKSIVVNPQRMFDATLQHFNRYVKSLYKNEDKILVSNFKTIVSTQYEIGSEDNIIGMTYEEFTGGA